ncbi:MAG: hypothetical protein LBR98_03110 [Syntrophomonadaceae bacterium]|jgi:uncharacterized protein YycO|nr:hypothetical protein [Syntrophomonadaceae bacterium]
MEKEKIHSILRLWILPLVAVVLCGLIFMENRTVITDTEGAVKFYLRSLKQGHGGIGDEGNFNNSISFAGLAVGDIVLGGYPNCGYGEYSHAALYIGEGMVLEGYGNGIYIQPVNRFRSYSQVALLKVEVAPEVKARAVDYALRQYKEAFYPLAFKKNERVWNCSKIIWKSYEKYGINLDYSNDLWIMPSIFKNSSYVRVIDERKI